MSPKEFLHLGSRYAIDQALSRMVKARKLLRVARGAYAVPVESRFGTRPPTPATLVHAMAQQSGEIVAPHGASSANVLGLTQQVPVREVYLTSGRSRKLQLGYFAVTMKHAPLWMLTMGPGQAGAAIRALKWLGPNHVEESVAKLHKTLTSNEWQALSSHVAAMPSWMAVAVARRAAHG
jgi:hypothetical protein